MRHQLSRHIRLALVLLFAACASPQLVSANQSGFHGLYDDATLKRVQKRYGKNIKAVLYEDIAAYLQPAERRSLRRTSISFPKHGDGGLFEYRVALDSGHIQFSALSIKFFDDLSLAFAWYERNKLDSRKIYAAVIDLYRGASQRPILETLGVPKDAWKRDAFVDDVSSKALKSAMAFLLLHELAHFHLQHKPYSAISSAEAIAQETACDAFALDVMRRMRTPPLGMVLFFSVLAPLDAEATTHPLNVDRLQAFANALRDKPEDFIERANRGVFSRTTILKLASDIEIIADTMRR